MPTKLHDYECVSCGHVQEEITHAGSAAADESHAAEDVRCQKCGDKMAPLVPATHSFSTIVATTNTSKRHKAGYVHQYVNRPATKTQSGPGGSQTKGGGIHEG